MAESRAKEFPQLWRRADAIRAHARLESNAALYDPPAVPTPEDELLAREERAIISRALGRLLPRYERVIRLRNGLGCAPHTLEQIGNQIGVQRERIRQIETKGYRELKRSGRPLLGLRGKYTGTQHAPAFRNLYRPRVELDAAAAGVEAAVARDVIKADEAQARRLDTPEAQRRFHEFAAAMYAKCGLAYPVMMREGISDHGGPPRQAD